MIDGLKVENFQSHKSTTVQFDPGVNVIVGNSDSGKSGLIRSLLLGITNKPGGAGFVSHWAKNKNGNQNKDCSVSIFKQNVELKRLKQRASNKYILGDQEFGAIGRDVPEQVQEFFNLSDVNIQHQHDRPFLLFETSGEVARILNKVVKLDVIDKALSGIDSKKRKNKKELDILDVQKDTLVKSLEQYEALDDFEELLKQYEAILEEKSALSASIGNLGSMIDSIESTEQYIRGMKPDVIADAENFIKERKLESEKYFETENQYTALTGVIAAINQMDRLILSTDHVHAAGRIIEDIIQKRDEQVRIKQNIFDITNLTESLTGVDRTISKSRAVSYADGLAADLIKAADQYGKLKSDVQGIETILSLADVALDTILTEQQEIEWLEDSLPDMCPVCGSVLKGDKCNT